MPRYHFNTSDGQVVRDPQGFECVDLAEAKQRAVRIAGETLTTLADDLFQTDFHLEVTNDAGLTLFSILVVATEAPAVKA